MTSNPNPSPLNPLPPVIWVLAMPLIAMEVVLSLGATPLVGGQAGIGWRSNAIQDFAFSVPVFRWMVSTGQYPLEHLMRFVTYPFVHGSVTHAIFALVFILALGKMVGSVFRAWAVLVLFFGSAIGGALVYAIFQDTARPLFGAYPAAYGFIGAYSFILWVNLTVTHGPRHQAFALIAFLMGLQLLFALLFGGQPDWVADLAGFATGFGLSFLVCPGGFSRAVDLIRRR